MPPRKGLDGTLSQLYSPRDSQNFAKGIGPIGTQEDGFLVRGAPSWSLSKVLPLLDAIPEEEGGPR